MTFPKPCDPTFEQFFWMIFSIFFGVGGTGRRPFNRRLGVPDREIVSFRCVRAGEAKLRERVRASVSLFENRISLAGPGRALRLSPQVFYFSARSKRY